MLLSNDCTDVPCIGYLLQREAKHVFRIARESQRFASKCQGTVSRNLYTSAKIHVHSHLCIFFNIKRIIPRIISRSF